MELRMMRLIAFIVIFTIFLAFIVLNLDNKCDISLGFKTFKEIPIFLSALFSFILGMLFAVPLVFSIGRKRKKVSGPEPQNGKWSIGSKKRKGRKEDDLQGTLSPPDDLKKENSPYGID